MTATKHDKQLFRLPCYVFKALYFTGYNEDKWRYITRGTEGCAGTLQRRSCSQVLSCGFRMSSCVMGVAVHLNLLISSLFRYHQWMSSPDLQKLTASEPLTLEQEYDMQKSWKEDNDSELPPYTCTCFMLVSCCHSRTCSLLDMFLCSFVFDFSPIECTFIVLDKQKWADPSIPEEGCMVGDVNIFLTDPSDPTLAELEIMIAGNMCLMCQIS